MKTGKNTFSLLYHFLHPCLTMCLKGGTHRNNRFNRTQRILFTLLYDFLKSYFTMCFKRGTHRNSRFNMTRKNTFSLLYDFLKSYVTMCLKKLNFRGNHCIQRRNTRTEIIHQNTLFIYQVFTKIPCRCFIVPAILFLVSQPLVHRMLVGTY